MSAQPQRRDERKGDRALRYAAAFAFAALSTAVVVYGLIDRRDPIVIFGLLCFAFASVVGRLEGAFKLGPTGVEGELPRPAPLDEIEAAAKRKAGDLGLDDDTARALKDFLVGRAVSLLRTMETLAGSEVVSPSGIPSQEAVGTPSVGMIEDHDRAKGRDHAFVTRAANELVDEIAANVRVFCKNGHLLDESPSLPVEDRQPCPVCGELGRRVEISLGGTVSVSGDLSMTRDTERDS